MALKSVAFVKKMFSHYYMNHYSPKSAIALIDRREFGFFLFEGLMLRHKSFAHEGALKEFIQKTVPSDVYRSCAYYEYPEASMDKKGWQGADLIFDIDADHISTPCNKLHDKWICGSCASAGSGPAPKKCPTCSNEKFEVKSWPCEVCLDSAKDETAKLLDMMLHDFGFSDEHVHVFFSGHRGYHVQIENELSKMLRSDGRKQIVDYVLGLGLDLHRYGLDKRVLAEKRPKRRVEEAGWSNRLLSGMLEVISGTDEEDLIRKAGLMKKEADLILQNRDLLKSRVNETGRWDSVRGIGYETYRKIAEYSLKKKSAQVDSVVTTDTHRLIRLADTLHSKTGMRKTELSISALDDFDPFKNAVAFNSGQVEVSVSEAPAFRVGDDELGPYRQESVDLPTAAALLLVCKERAVVVE